MYLWLLVSSLLELIILRITKTVLRIGSFKLFILLLKVINLFFKILVTCLNRLYNLHQMINFISQNFKSLFYSIFILFISRSIGCLLYISLLSRLILRRLLSRLILSCFIKFLLLLISEMLFLFLIQNYKTTFNISHMIILNSSFLYNLFFNKYFLFWLLLFQLRFLYMHLPSLFIFLLNIRIQYLLIILNIYLNIILILNKLLFNIFKIKI